MATGGYGSVAKGDRRSPLQHLDLGPKKGTFMALNSDSQRNLLSGRIWCLLSLAGTLALLICLCYPDGSQGFSPSSETQRIKPRRSVATPSVVTPPGPAPTRGRGTVESGTGIRIHVQPAVPAQRRILIRERQFRPEPPGDYSKIRRTLPSRSVQTLPQQIPARKLAKPRVPYLTELALDIDRALANRALQQPTAAAAIHKNSLSLAEKGGNPAKIKEAATNLGHVYYLTGRFPEAVASYSKAVLINRRIGDKTGEATALRNLAASFTAAGEFLEAEQRNLEALRLLQTSGSARDLQIALNNLGVLEKNRAKYSRSLDWYETALQIPAESEDVRAIWYIAIWETSSGYGESAKSPRRIMKHPRRSGPGSEMAKKPAKPCWIWVNFTHNGVTTIVLLNALRRRFKPWPMRKRLRTGPRNSWAIFSWMRDC